MIAILFIFSYFNLKIISYASSLLFILFLFNFYKISKELFFISLVFIIGWVWNLISLLYIENGSYITEQNTFGYFTNSSTRFSLYCSLFIFSGILAWKLNPLRKTSDSLSTVTKTHKFENLSINFSFFILFILFLIGLIYGFPILSGISRFEYWKPIDHLQKFVFLSPIACFFIGYCYGLSNSKKIIILLLFHILFLFLFSDKFTGPYLIFIYFFTGYSLSLLSKNNTKNIKIINWKLIIFVIPSISIVLISTVAYGYLILHGLDPNFLIDQILSRAFSLQGHVWYGIDLLTFNNNFHPDPSLFLRENNEPTDPAGLPYLMYQISNPGFVTAMREAGIRFTNGYPAILLSSFGFHLGLFFQFIVGFCFYIFSLYFLRKLFKQQFFMSFLCLIFFNNIISNSLIMGEIYYIYKPLSLALILFFLLDIFLIKINKKIKTKYA